LSVFAQVDADQNQHGVEGEKVATERMVDVAVPTTGSSLSSRAIFIGDIVLDLIVSPIG